MTHNMMVFDVNAVQRNMTRAHHISRDTHNEKGADFLTPIVNDAMMDRRADIRRDFDDVLTLNTMDHLDDVMSLGDQSYDLIMAPLMLHWVNDLPGVLVQIKNALRTDGVFLAAMLGGETLHELRATLMAVELDMMGGVSPRVSPVIDMRDMGALMQRAQFALPVVDHDCITATYADMFGLIADLRAMGHGNAIMNRSHRYMGREFWAKAAQYYADHYTGHNGRINATFDIIYSIGWAPAATQQKPLKPGTATVRLADALRTTEQSTGDYTPHRKKDIKS